MQISRETPRVVCVASDFCIFHPTVPLHTALLGLKPEPHFGEGKNSHFAVGFVTSSNIKQFIQVSK